MGEEKKRTAREIIENYDGAAVRIMEVCGTTYTRDISTWHSQTSATTGGTDLWSGMPGLRNTSRIY